MSSLFVVDRKDFRATRWLDRPAAALAPGRVRLAIELFSLTSNNITYAAFGEAMRYWNFFPTDDGTTGCIPVWGFAMVRESKVEGVRVGDRFYGYLPMADEVDLQPVAVRADGFADGAAHRRELPKIYNRYIRTASDPLYRAEHEGLIALLRPLFTTSFLIDDFLAENTFFGARSVLVSSASSKTSYGLAFCLAARQGQPGAPATIGLTSSSNVAFTRGLGCYDDVLAYDGIDASTLDGPVVYVDMSGDVGVRERIHRRFEGRLAYSCSVGATHWQELGSAKGLPGPRPVLFFAPSQGEKRVAEWGAAEFAGRLATSWNRFVERVGDPARPWLRVTAGEGRDAVRAAYLALLEGKVAPDVGWVLKA